ncbi:MAG TPA: FGGY family carbohydrate kinase [Solirubrobacteraceae bacterium]|nr:FGGY family carbohydrate kinase [Solirubrobacteraceae bacterium]
MSETLLLGIDEGTTAVKAALLDTRLNPVAESRRAVATSHPAPGRVEQDPEEVLEAVAGCVAEVLKAAPADARVVAGLAHQGESVLAWEAGGTAITPIVVWQDKRQEALLAELGEAAVERSGLPLDPYFSAGKLAWLVAHEPAVAAAADRGRLRLGTVDAYLTDRLGGRFATDLSTASRTQLLALGGEDWDRGLLDAFGLRREWLPTTGPTWGALGRLRHPSWPREVELTAKLVDQQAALAGSGCVSPGQTKATYGTGVFVLARTERPLAVPGLLPTVAWAAPGPGGEAVGEPEAALDGGIFTAGALLEWMADGLGLAKDVPALARLAASVADTGGVRVLPALAGLGSPWWEPGAQGVIAGLSGGTRPAHVARAALEAIAHRVADVVEAIATVAPIASLRVDGGLTNDPTLLQVQADLLGLPLEVLRADTTALGAATLAGVGAGVFGSPQSAARDLPSGRTIEPTMAAAQRERERARWREFVARAAVLG